MNNRIKNISSFDYDNRKPQFKYSANDHSLMERLNCDLAALNNLIESQNNYKSGHSLIIVGAPRSGSTFLGQCIARNNQFAYVSNLMARFYSSPFVGAWLQGLLFNNELSLINEFTSLHGVTKYVFEPHEFGYFWAENIPFSNDNHEDVDLRCIEQSMHNIDYKLGIISSIFARPVIYKCAIAPFILNYFIEHTNSLFVIIRRSKKSVVDSILKTRFDRMLDKEVWWSIRPRGWRDSTCLPSFQQVEFQYESVYGAIDRALLDPIANGRFINVDYENLTIDPDAEISRIISFYNMARFENPGPSFYRKV